MAILRHPSLFSIAWLLLLLGLTPILQEQNHTCHHGSGVCAPEATSDPGAHEQKPEESDQDEPCWSCVFHATWHGLPTGGITFIHPPVAPWERPSYGVRTLECPIVSPSARGPPLPGS